MELLAIDPGTTQSAYVLYSGQELREKGILVNEDLIEAIEVNAFPADRLAVEMLECYGMPVGREVFHTLLYMGRMIQAFQGVERRPYSLVTRRDVKLHLCGTSRAKDANVTQALMDKFGGRQACKGTVKDPGPLHGVKTHIWAALGVAVTWFESEVFEGDRREHACIRRLAS